LALGSAILYTTCVRNSTEENSTMKHLVLKPLFDFLIVMTIFTFLFWIVIIYLGLASHSVFYAWATMALNATIGYLLCEYVHALKSNKFLRTLLIGQSLRWIAVASIVILLVRTQLVNIAEFAWATLAFCLCYMSIEIFAILNKMRFEKRLEKLLQL
jgi:glucan phosphoethanolaminetransferase (alkaline phosphatase superfamily)